jgi:phage-related minor tail protein
VVKLANENNYIGVAMGLDVSDLKAGIAEANKQIQLANSKFKAASSEMDDWTKSTTGLTAKIEQLDTVLTMQKKKLSGLEAEYEKVSKEQGETSEAARKLQVQIYNQQSVVNKTERELENYRQTLQGVEDGTIDLEKVSIRGGKAIEKAGKQTEEAGDKAERAGDGFTVMKGAISSLVADGIKAASSALKDFIFDTDQASTKFQAMTGSSVEEMAKFNEQINELYALGRGESLTDIAQAMALVAQNTKETDPEKIKELTQNAIALRDTFDFGIEETMRAVNMLMDQFGVSGEEAYNLIVQGAQNGLNKNGELLDVINEYGVHYKQLGYTSDEFFNSLINGAATGVFSVDNLGDAMKEFGIRTKDGSKLSTEAFVALGLVVGDNSEAIAKAEESIGSYNEKIAKLEQNLKYAEITQKGFNEKTNELTRQKNADSISAWSKELEKLKDDEGLTCNSGVIQGGSVSNTVPKECVVKINIRFANEEQRLYAIDYVNRVDYPSETRSGEMKW